MKHELDISHQNIRIYCLITTGSLPSRLLQRNVVVHKENQVNVCESTHLHYNPGEKYHQDRCLPEDESGESTSFLMKMRLHSIYSYLISRLEAVFWLSFQVPWEGF